MHLFWLGVLMAAVALAMAVEPAQALGRCVVKDAAHFHSNADGELQPHNHLAVHWAGTSKDTDTLKPLGRCRGGTPPFHSLTFARRPWLASSEMAVKLGQRRWIGQLPAALFTD